MKIEHTLTIRIIYQSLYLKSVYMQNAKEELNFKKNQCMLSRLFEAGNLEFMIKL